MTQTKTKVLAKVIDDETIFEAAKYISKDIPETHHLKREDVFQEAYIHLLEKRMGKNFHMSVKYSTVDLMRKFFGRKDVMSKEDYDKRYALDHGAHESVSFDPPTLHDKEIDSNYDLICKELELFAEKEGYLEEFFALVNAEKFRYDPIGFISHVRGVTRKYASERFLLFKNKVKEHYDFEFFA